MIKTAVKLAIVALVVNATWQAFNAYWPHVKFEDSVRSMLQYRGERSDDQLRARILELASNYDIPIGEEDVDIRRTESHTIVDTAYVRPVNLAPGFVYRWPLKMHVDAFTVEAPIPAGSIPK